MLNAPAPRWSVPRRFAVAGASAAVMTLAVACSSTSTGSAAGGTHRDVLTSVMTPSQTLRAAALQAQRITSDTYTVNIRVSGATDLTERATAAFRLKPTLEISADEWETASGKTAEVKVAATGAALYFNAAALSAQVGKPWVEIKLARLKGTPLASLIQLIQRVKTNAYGNQTWLYSVTKNVHAVGTQTIDHVRTTEYTGSFQEAAARAALPAAARKLVAPVSQAPGNSVITFRAWIDAQHHLRMATEVVTFNGSTINTTVTYTSINQPVTITLPPASQTVIENNI
jgi:hypothetical protein